jgi:PKHD-type hydroxylase
MFVPFEIDKSTNQIITTPNIFTKEECEIIIDFFNKKEKLTAAISNVEVINKEIRKNKVVWLSNKDVSLNWVVQRISNYVYQINKEFFNFDIYGLTEDIQFTEYSEINDHYEWHTDSSVGGMIRKLSFSIQLSDPKDYDGCKLEFFKSDKDKIKEDNTCIEQGTGIAFPSYMLHRVTPLISGTRCSLVVWVGGPNFK